MEQRRNRTVTSLIGLFFEKIILLIVRALALSKIHPNVLTFIGLVINIGAAACSTAIPICVF